MKKKIALIFGITGQDGSLLARFLIKKGYIVHGIKRRSSSFNTVRIDDIYETRYKSKLKKKIDRVFQTIYGQKDFEFNPINLMTLTGLNNYLLISYDIA